MALTLLEDRPEARFAHSGPVLVAVFCGEFTLGTLECFLAHQKTLIASYGSLTMLSVVAVVPKQPSAELRQQINANLREVEAASLGQYIVVTAKGLGAIIARTFLAALSLVSNERLRVFASTREAVAAIKALPQQSTEVRANVNLASDVESFVNAPPGVREVSVKVG